MANSDDLKSLWVSKTSCRRQGVWSRSAGLSAGTVWVLVIVMVVRVAYGIGYKTGGRRQFKMIENFPWKIWINKKYTDFCWSKNYKAIPKMISWWKIVWCFEVRKLKENITFNVWGQKIWTQVFPPTFALGGRISKSRKCSRVWLKMYHPRDMYCITRFRDYRFHSVCFSGVN